MICAILPFTGISKPPIRKVIHPVINKKEYNTEAKRWTVKRESLFSNLQKEPEEESQKFSSSLKKMLDENDSRSNGKK